MTLKTPLLIGLTGLAGCGKDTVRDILEAQHSYHGLALADPIRAMLTTLLKTCHESDDYITKREFKELAIPGLSVSYRHLAQTLGTEWGRSIAPNFWTQIATTQMDAVRTLQDKPVAFVISDIRFVTEAQWLRRRGGTLWRITRPYTDPVRTHVSEQEMAHIQADHTIANDSSIADLVDAVYNALNQSAKKVQS